MAIIKTVEGKTPHWGKNCFIAENAALMGDCVLGMNATVLDKADIGEGAISLQQVPWLRMARKFQPMRFGRGK